MKNFTLITILILMLLVIGLGCDEQTRPNTEQNSDVHTEQTTKDESYQKNLVTPENETLSDQDTIERIQTPEEVIELFTSALEADDPILAASYFSLTVRDRYEKLFSRADLSALADDLRKYPPMRIRNAIPNEEYVLFVSKRTVKNEVITTPINLYIEQDEWKIVIF